MGLPPGGCQAAELDMPAGVALLTLTCLLVQPC
jgi:hypothetical protein